MKHQDQVLMGNVSLIRTATKPAKDNHVDATGTAQLLTTDWTDSGAASSDQEVVQARLRAAMLDEIILASTD